MFSFEIGETSLNTIIESRPHLPRRLCICRPDKQYSLIFDRYFCIERKLVTLRVFNIFAKEYREDVGRALIKKKKRSVRQNLSPNGRG